MKKRLKHLFGAVIGLSLFILYLLPHEGHARYNQTRYDPCICYTYFSNGTIEESASCDSPALNGACPKLVICQPKNKEDR